jgi:hypothetical protein
MSSAQPMKDFRHGSTRRFLGSSLDFGSAGHCRCCAPLSPPPGLIFFWPELPLVVLAVVFPVRRFFSPLVFPVGRSSLRLHRSERVFQRHQFSLAYAESTFQCNLACSVFGLWRRHRRQGAARSLFSADASSAFIFGELRSNFVVQVWNLSCCSLLASSTHLCHSIIVFFADFSSTSVSVALGARPS